MPDYFNPEAPVTSGIHNLPHWQQEDVWIFLTWRLADSLPLTKLRQWQQERQKFFIDNPEPWSDETHIAYRKQFTDEIEAWLDRGLGKCHLKLPAIREIVFSAFRHFDGVRYDLDSFVIMPNHVHLLLRILEPNNLPDIVRSLKSFSAKRANRELARAGNFWQRDYYDRLIRSPKHFHWARGYIERNPKNLAAGTFTVYLKEHA